MNENLEREATAAIARGWNITPLRGKIPSLKNWPNLPPPTSGEVHRFVYEGANFGVLTGKGLVVVDVDPGADPELLTKLSAIVTPTVRTGRDGRHFYFSGNGKCSVGKISEHVDIRGDGGQVVLPGSIHPDTGQPYTWILTPSEAPLAPYPPWLEDLARAARRIRRAKPGTRNETLNKATFAAASAGAPTRELADAATDAGLEHHEIEATITSATDAAPTFAPTFVEGEILVPGEHFFNTGETLTIDQTSFCESCWKRIPKGLFYCRLSTLGEIVNHTFQPINEARFRARASRFLPLYAYVKQGRSFERECRQLSADLASIVVAAAPEYVEEIRAIVCHPLSRGPHDKWLVMGEHPMRKVINHAGFWEEVLIDFPFSEVCYRHAYVALLLTMVMRPRIKGPVPLWIITATQPRTGKTKLITEVASKLVYGRQIANIALGDDEAEIDKRLISRAMSAHTLFPFDNVGHKVDSAVLAAFLSSPVYCSRVLGQSRTVEFENDAIVVITGNNIRASEEIAKRTIHCRLEARSDHPELRTEFIHDLTIYLDAIRPDALGSLMGMSEMEGAPFVLGGYESWGKLVGGAMAAAGMPLSIEAYQSWTAEADDQTEDVRVLVARWSEVLLGERCAVEQILSLVRDLNIMGSIFEAKTERGERMRLGWTLRSINGRVFGNYRVTSDGTGSRRAWILTDVSDPPE